MSPYTKIVSSVLFPLHERLKGHSTVAVRKSMEKQQWLPPAELELLRVRKLRTFLTGVSRQVPYYKKLFAQLDFKPERVDSLRDLQALPLLDKTTIRANGSGLVALGAGPLTKLSTGGSTGEPLTFYLGKERVSHDVAAKWRATRWWGVDIGDPELVVWGSPIELGAQDKVRRIRDQVFRTGLLPAFNMSTTHVAGYVEAIKKVKPRILFGYPSALALIAQYAAANNVNLSDSGIKVVFVTSEALYEHQRELIQSVFGAAVANGYGSRDAGFIAHECPFGSLHITADDIILESVGEDGHPVAEGELGELVVTHMATSEYPFIRYLTGDMGRLTSKLCDCGRTLPVLKEVQGRTTDFVVAQDGSLVHALALIYVLRDTTGIAQFKVVQESMNLLHLYIKETTVYSKSSEAVIRQNFQARLGRDVRVEIYYVDAIPTEKNGKYRYVSSNVDLSTAV